MRYVLREDQQPRPLFTGPKRPISGARLVELEAIKQRDKEKDLEKSLQRTHYDADVMPKGEFYYGLRPSGKKKAQWIPEAKPAVAPRKDRPYQKLATAVILQVYRNLRSTSKRRRKARIEAQEWLYSEERREDREHWVAQARLPDDVLDRIATLTPAEVRQRFQGRAWQEAA